jgi:hypothetical protein
MLLIVSLVGDGGHDDGKIFIVQYYVPIQFVDGTVVGEEVGVIQFGEGVAAFG